MMNWLYEVHGLAMWQFVLAVVFSWACGFLSGASLLYPIGRRHGITEMAKAWRKSIIGDRDEPTEHI